jgi:threonine aldolase
MEILSKKYAFHHWLKVDDNHTAVRFCTSWATRKDNVEFLIKDIEAL